MWIHRVPHVVSTVAKVAVLAAVVTAVFSAPTRTLPVEVYPGQALFARGGDGPSCTLAFLVHDSVTLERVVLTAGHCAYMGNLGVRLRTGYHGLTTMTGKWELSVSRDRSSRDEWERDGAVLSLGAYDPATSMVGGDLRVGDAVTEEELRGTDARVYKLGAVTGFTCGTVTRVKDGFVTVADWDADEDHRISYRGDSGAPMFMFSDDGTVRPVALISHGRSHNGDLDPRIVVGQLVAPLLEQWRMSLVQS